MSDTDQTSRQPTGEPYSGSYGAPYSGPPPTQPPPPQPPVEFDGGADEPRPSSRPSVRQRVGPRSLTSKLVIGVVSLVILLVLLIGGGTYFQLKSFLSQRLDQQLQTTAGQGIRNVLQTGSSTSPTPATVYAAAIGARSGEFLGGPPASESLAPMKLTTSEGQQLLNLANGSAMTVETTDGEELRVTVIPNVIGFSLSNGTEVPARLVVGLSTQDERGTLHRLVLLEVLIGGAAVLIAILATTYGVGFGLRRLRRVTITAQEVASELSPEGAGLDRRVPDDEPETEVGQLATSFNMMLAAVETQFAARVESEQRMRQFMADASHELRTPLTSIRGYAELARMQRAAGDTSDDNIDRIEFEGTRMSRLVEDLLTLARGDAGGSSQMNTELVDLDGLLADASSGSRAAFPARQIDVSVQGDPQVIGDRDQLLRVVRNLVNNAAVHTVEDRPIVLHAFDDAAAGAVIQVVDGGPGLPADEAAHVFERFWRADKARTRVRGGSGLGLSIVATIVRNHGGTVSFESSVEAGSTVTVVLPSVESGQDEELG